MKVLREVADRVAVWTYLSHEDRYKGTLRSIRTTLSLDGDIVPTLSAGEIIAVVERGEFDNAEYGHAVALTCRVLASRKWTEREFTSAELGGVQTVLSDGGLPALGAFVPGKPGPASALLDGWRDFLRLPQVATEAGGHAAIVAKLQAEMPIGWIMLREEDHPMGRLVIADGRHRLFAVLDVAAATGERRALVLYGDRRS
jgi:hypothetical protein